MKYRESDPRWVSDNEMDVMQKLWMNGLSVRQINVIFSKYSRDTVRRYVKDMKRLPRKMRKISFADFKRTPDAIMESSTISNEEEAISKKNLTDLEEWRETIRHFSRKGIFSIN